MRIRVLLAVAALAVAIAPAARASSLPDLPGMGPAQKAIGGQSTATTAATPTTRTKRTPVVTAASAASSAKSSTADAEKTIRDLPGGAALPVIGKSPTGLASAHSAIPGTDTLVLIAALGSFAALGSLYMLRKLGRI